MQVATGLGSFADCALTLRSTVVSRPMETRAMLDAGSKALAADQCAAPGHGHIIECRNAVIGGLNEERGIVDLTACTKTPEIGDVVHVIPNHVCVVSNLFDRVHLVEGSLAVEVPPIAARGRSDKVFPSMKNWHRASKRLHLRGRLIWNEL